MTLTAKATDALIQALNCIYEHPEEWNQSYWMAFFRADEYGDEGWSQNIPVEQSTSCGTAACLAGRVALQNPLDFQFYTFDGEDGKTWVDGAYVRYRGVENIHDTGEAVIDFLTEGSTDLWEDQSILGSAFDADNTEDDLWYWVSKVADRDLDYPDGVDITRSAYYGE